jgi:cytochrome c oxidase subunit II
MPVRVARKLAFLVTTIAALATAGVAAAANGGFTPPDAHSPNASHVNTAYYLILGFTAAIFVIVEVALVVFIWRYRSRGRGREVEGAQVHGHTRLELIWTVIPVVILAIIGVFIFIQLPKIADVPSATASGGRLNITVEGHQFYWQFDYPNGARSIGDLHVPVGKVVYLTIESPDVNHSWWIPELAGKTDAIPGRTNHSWFKVDEPGTYIGQCAEFCGTFHEAMRARVIATSDAEYQSFISKGATAEIGRAEFQGVCATCHGMQGEGDYGPSLQSSSLVTKAASLDAIVRNGRGKMPPVGKTWTKEQLSTLLAYLKKNVYKGAASANGG